MRDALQDLRFAWRGLRSTPAAASLAVVILAVGGGLNTTIVALAHGVLVRPLPYPEASRLVLVTVGGRHDPDEGIPLSAFEDWRAQLRLVDPIAAYTTTQYTLRGLGEPRVVQAALVTDAFFDVLKAQPLRGRVFGRSESGTVLSEQLARQLGAATNDDLLGKAVTVAERPFTVVGIMPDAVAFPSERVLLWLPVRDSPAIELSRGEDARRFRLLARMLPGARAEHVRDEARRVVAELRIEKPDAFGDFVASAQGLQERLVAPVRPILLVFVIGAALVLFVASANTGSLLLARAVAREREVAVRIALGAARARVIGAVLAEAFVVALAGAALGAILAVWALRMVSRLAAGMLPRLHEVAIDVPVLLASLATAGFVALMCGTAPALHALRTDVAPAFRQMSGSRSRRVRRVTGALVAQIAASVVLLIGAGLLIRTVVGLLRVDVGIEPRNAVATTLLLTDEVGFDAAGRRPFIADLTRELHALPGVLHAGVGSSFPPQSSMVEVEFRTVSGGREEYSGLIGLASVTPGYFGALGIPLLAGRLLDQRDANAEYPVAVVSRSVARRLFGSQDPVGRTLPSRLPGVRKEPPRIVGIVGDVRYSGLEAPAGGAIYIPWEDLPVGVVNLAVRTTGDPAALGPAIRNAIHRVDPGQPVGNIRPLDHVIAGVVADRRLQAILILSFGGVALLLAVLGLVAGLARAVGERRRELAIRIALGSSPQRMIKLVVANGAALLVIGIAIGVTTAALAAGGLAGMVYGLSPRDPPTYGTAAAIVAFTGLVGCYLPARRAAQISPAELLRSE